MDNLILLARIDDNPFQTRSGYDEAGIAELAADIAARGLLQAPVGRLVLDGKPLDAGLYGGVQAALGDEPGARVQLAFGHRRLRAVRLLDGQGRTGTATDARWEALPVNVQMLSDEQMALYAWSENSQRKDITAIEEAQAIQRMMAMFGWGQAEIGTRLGVDRSTVANKLRLLRLPAEVQARVARREVSERQAMALAPLYDLPAKLLENFEKEHPYSHPKPHDLVQRAHQETSDRLRQDVIRVIQEATAEMSGLWAEHAFVDRYVKAEVCAKCAEIVRIDGKARCTVKSCRERKQALWEALRLSDAQTNSGIRPLDVEFSWQASTTLQHVPHPERILEKGCPNLRLHWVKPDDGVTRLRVDGYPDVEIICVHGNGNRCTCETQAKSAATREANQAPDVQASKAERKRIDQELVEPAEAAVLAALAADALGVWQHLVGRVSFGGQGAPATVEACKEKIAHSLLGDAVAQWLRVPEPNYGTVKEHAERRLKEFGITPPWQVTPLEALRRRYERCANWVAHRQWWQWNSGIDAPALRGNLDNLNTLAAELDALHDESDAAISLESEIAVDRDLILRLLPVAEDLLATKRTYSAWSEIHARCQRLETAEPGSLVFGEALAAAERNELRYALAIGGGFERTMALTARLEKLIAAGEMAECLPL